MKFLPNVDDLGTYSGLTFAWNISPFLFIEFLWNRDDFQLFRLVLDLYDLPVPNKTRMRSRHRRIVEEFAEHKFIESYNI